MALLCAGFSSAAGASPAVRASSKVPSCFGKKATIFVPGNGRHVVGTKRNDVIVALGSGDVINGGAGNDLICAGAAKLVDGGAGNDKISMSGNGTVHGDAGNDTIVLGKGNAKAYGDAGNDVITGGTGNQRLDGGAGNDRITGGTKGRFTLIGGAGNDVLVVRDGGNSVDGGAGADMLVIAPKWLSSTHYVRDAADTLNGHREAVPVVAGGGAATLTVPATTNSTPAPTATPTPSAGASPSTSPSPSDSPSPTVTPTSAPTSPSTSPSPTTSPSTSAPASPTLSPSPSTSPSTSAPSVPAPTATLTIDGAVGTDLLTQYSSATPGSNLVPGYTVAAGDRIVSWSLSFGDGTTPHQGNGTPPQNVSHFYRTAGQFTAVLTVVGAAGSSGTASAAVDVAGTPTMAANLPVSVSGSVATVDLSSASAPGAAFDAATVDWGDGTVDAVTSGFGSSVHHDYGAKAGGQYVINVAAETDHGGSVTGTATASIDPTHAHAYIRVAARDTQGTLVGYTVASKVTGSVGEGIVLQPFTTVFPVSLDYGDGSAVGGSGSYAHQYSAPGTYTVVLTAGGSGNTVTSTVTVDIVTPGAVAQISGLAAKAAVGQQVTVSTAGSHVSAGAKLASYQLSWGDGLTDSGSGSLPATLTHSYAAPGSYDVDLAIADDHYVTAQSVDRMTLVQGSAPSIAFCGYADPTYDTSDCSWLGTFIGQTNGVYFTATMIPAAGEQLSSYSLDYGDGSASTSGALSPDSDGTTSLPIATAHGYSAAGEYDAVLTVHDSAGATFARTMHVSVAAVPSIALAATYAPATRALTVVPTITGTAGDVVDDWGLSTYFILADPDETNPPFATPSSSEGNGAPTTRTITVANAHPGDQVTVLLIVATDHGVVVAKASTTFS